MYLVKSSPEYFNKHRKAMLAKIHIAKKELELTEEEYRTLLREVTGKDSCKYMKVEELDKVLQVLYLFGFVGKKKLNWNSLHFHKDGVCFHLENLARLVMGTAWKKRLQAYIKKRFGVDSIHFLNFSQLCSVFAFLRRIQQQQDPF